MATSRSGSTSSPATAARGTGTAPPSAAGLSAEELSADIASIVAEHPRRSADVGDRGPASAPRPAQPGDARQAIFDQLASSIAGARSFDLGEVELERRFDEFDRLSDASGVRSPAPAPVRTLPASHSRSSSPSVGSTSEVLEDLDAIRSQAAGDIALDPGVGGRSVGADALEPGDIILSTTTHPLSQQIRAVTGAEVSHAAVYVGNGRVVEAIDGGVVLRSLTTALDDDSLAVAYRHRDMTATKAALMVPFLEDHARQQTPYDRWGLVQVAPGQLARAICNRFDGEARQRCLASASALKVGTNDENAFFCSELVLEALARAGLSMSTLEPSWSSPGQLVELHHNGTLDYVGHLKG